jgi:hypothetical protein
MNQPADDLDYPTAFVNLIDAMRAYLRCNKMLGEEFLREGSITREQYDAAMADDAPLAAWLQKSEEHGIRPELFGILKQRGK